MNLLHTQCCTCVYDVELVKFFLIAPTPPRNVEAVQLDSTSLEITWDQPEKLNGIIREYELWYSYYEATSLVQVENRKSIDAIASPQRRFVLKGLMMNTRYNVSVRERTDVRLWSKRSTIRVTTKEGGKLSLFLHH